MNRLLATVALLTVLVMAAGSRADSGETGSPAGVGESSTNGVCHSSYEGACLDPNSYDYDCEGGSGDGPDYTGAVRVVGDDPFALDRDGDGSACEPYW
jgi:hypothetical protein